MGLPSTTPAQALQPSHYTAAAPNPQPCPYKAPAHALHYPPALPLPMPLNHAPTLPLPMPLTLDSALLLPMSLPLPTKMDPVFTTFFRLARVAFIGRDVEGASSCPAGLVFFFFFFLQNNFGEKNSNFGPINRAD